MQHLSVAALCKPAPLSDLIAHRPRSEVSQDGYRLAKGALANYQTTQKQLTGFCHSDPAIGTRQSMSCAM